ncbi:hypothetical protein N1851_014050 [Merluccius polli]|uniref:Myb/SANT-like DNA-binding domain-containing protein n=1 Tax=Merluccius polli TaxID=89951 RepID=A0AA47MV34_MERPO|nr:hypothetical protein N1851_014050 [Merluccius polli]
MNKGKKRNFTQSELEILVNEVETRREILFGTLSAGINLKRKRKVKKKWSDLKVEVKRRVSAHGRSVTATGGGTGVGELSPFDQRVACLVGDTALTGVVGAHEGDTDHPQDDKTGVGTGSSIGPRVSTGPGISTPAADRPTGRVLTRAVLESQGEIVRAIGGINDRLDRLINVLSDINTSINALVNKSILSLPLYMLEITFCRARMASWGGLKLTGPASGSSSGGMFCSGSGMPWRCATLWRTPQAITMWHTFSGRYSSTPPDLSRQRHRPFSRPIALSTTARVREWRSLYLLSWSVLGSVRGVISHVRRG